MLVIATECSPIHLRLPGKNFLWPGCFLLFRNFYLQSTYWKIQEKEKSHILMWKRSRELNCPPQILEFIRSVCFITSKLPIQSLDPANRFGLSSNLTNESWIWRRLGTRSVFPGDGLRFLKWNLESQKSLQGKKSHAPLFTLFVYFTH